jgi:hypothetical protein
MPLFRHWQPASLTECSCCGLPTNRPDARLSVLCPDCVTEIKATVARESRSYRRSEYGGGEFPPDGGGRRGR